MHLIDMRNSTARLSLETLRTSGRRYVSNPVAFSTFVAGVRLSPDTLLAPEWTQPAGAAGRHAFFRQLMHGLLPRSYDVRHLEALGGRFALRVNWPARYELYTVIALNRRVVTLAGLPVDEAGAPVIDASIQADAFLAVWNDLLAELAAGTLARVDAARAVRRRTSQAA